MGKAFVFLETNKEIFKNETYNTIFTDEWFDPNSQWLLGYYYHPEKLNKHKVYSDLYRNLISIYDFEDPLQITKNWTKT